MRDLELDLLICDVERVVARLKALAEKPVESDPILTLDEVQQRFGVGRTALLNAAERGELKISRGPRKRIQARLSELERWLDADTAAVRRAASSDDGNERARQLQAWRRGAA